MHDGDVEVVGDVELFGVVAELLEPGTQGVQELEVVVGLDPRVHHFLLQLGEGVGVGALVALQETQDVLHLVALELLVDGVQVVGLLLPELELGQGTWVVALFQCLLGLQLQNIFDLFGPGDDGTLEDVCFVFVRSRLRSHQLRTRHRQHRLSVDQPDHHEGLSDKVVISKNKASTFP